jgi:thiamine-monophosphate kinase
VAGRLGWSAAGFAALRRGFRSPKVVVDAHRRPEPPYAMGPAAADAGASSMIDVSDGLVADLGHVAAASGVRISLDTAAFARPDALVEVASALGADLLSWVLAGGEDHALVATFPAESSLPTDFSVVGQVVEGEPGVLVDGRTYAIRGFDHFA